MLQKITIVKKCCSFESEDPENKYIAVSTQILNNKTVFSIDDKKYSILEWFFSVPCDTKDWSNDAENSALHHRNKVQYYYNTVKLQHYFIILLFYCIFDRMN